jgi:predicted Zn-dependent protease
VAGTDGDAAGYRLEFRSSEALGANAFALPGGTVLLTDGMVELARSDDELAAVMAHEIGHVRQRHVMRHVLQNSVTALIVATLTGDVTSITSLAATLPTAVVDATFSRQFEREADDAAVAWLKSANVDPRRYAELLARLQAQLDTRSGDAFKEKSPVHNYLSNHPETGERIRRIVAAGS